MDNVRHLLVVDDDTRIRDLLSRFLCEHGYYISTAKDVKSANALLKQYIFDLLVVDVMMPGESGIEFTNELRKTSPVPVLMLTAMGEVEDRITGLSAGADDYLAKPFEPRELLLRIQNIINRTSMDQTASPHIRFGSCSFDLQTGSLNKNGSLVTLTTTETDILRMLCQHINRELSREILAHHLSGINERSVDVLITRLRNKIEDNPKQPTLLKTIRGKGYVLYGH